MSSARVLPALVWADLLERVRRYSFLITMGLAVYLGYLAAVGRITLAVNHMRGIYNSAWVGSLLALVGSTFLTLAGFYFVKNAIQRDRDTGVGQILAATPISKFKYVLGKSLSNFVVLALMIAILAIAAIAMQLLLGEDTHIRLWRLLSPFLFLALPAMAVTAALAVTFETVPFLKGGFGNVAYFFLWTAMLAVPAASGNQHVDLGGIAIIQQSTRAAGHVTEGNSSFELNAGMVQPIIGTFQWDGVSWTGELLLARLVVVGVALGLILFAALIFDRFDTASTRRLRKTPPVALAGAIPAGVSPAVIGTAPIVLSPITANAARNRFPAVLVAEIKLMLKGQKWWWYAVAAGLFAASAAVPTRDGRGIALACAWIWPVLLWSSMGIREARYRTDQILFSSPHPIARQLPAIWLAGVAISVLTGGGFALRLLIDADLRGLFAWGVGAIFIPTAALALGVWSGTGKPFEILFTILWYVGPLHATPALDFMGSAAATATTRYPVFYLVLTVLLAIVAVAGRKRQLLQ